MAAAKDTPRQKMIGMMYLVLTALLALNVSKDILDAFVVVNKGLENTNNNFTDRNENLYAQFDLAKSIDPVLVIPNWKKAQEIKKESDELSNFIDKLQKQLVEETEGIEQDVADTLQMANIESKDNYDIPTNILIGDSEDGSAGASGELKKKLIEYRTKLNSYILPVDKTKVKVDINTDDPIYSEENENWEMYNFYNRPLVASMTILSKLKSDVKNAESLLVDYLLKQNDVEVMKFDTIAAKVIPQSNYVLLGEKYTADIFIAAFSKTKKPEVVVDNNPIEVQKGLGKYSSVTTKEGIINYSGTIKMVSPKGKEVIFPFKSEYIVARPALTVSADKMNVVYFGLDNPISVSVPGIPNERLTVSATNAILRPDGNGKFIMKVNRGPNVDVNVFATMENGERRNMGIMSFRVKQIPKPSAKFGDLIESGKMSKSKIESQMGLIAFYDNFDFKATPKVTSFKMAISSAAGVSELKSTGNLVTDEMKKQIKSLKKGQKVIFEEINAVGPDGITKKLSDLVVTVL
ncbi:MAG: type IX secretion system motor protein PorM/GldM [Bacteroidota bacterium]